MLGVSVPESTRKHDTKYLETESPGAVCFSPVERSVVCSV